MRFRLCLSWIQIDKKNQGIHHKGDISLVTWKWLQGQSGIERREDGIELLSCFSIDALLLRYNWLLRRFCIFLSGEWDVSLSLYSLHLFFLFYSLHHERNFPVWTRHVFLSGRLYLITSLLFVEEDVVLLLLLISLSIVLWTSCWVLVTLFHLHPPFFSLW